MLSITIARIKAYDNGWIKGCAVFLLFVLLTLFLRMSSFYLHNLSWDEGLYLVISQDLMEGIPPYVTAWDHKPPGIYFIYLLSQLLFGKSILSIRIATFLVVSITCFILFKIGELVSGDDRVGLLAGGLYAVLSASNEGLAANTELFYAFFVTLAYYLFIDQYLFKNSVRENYGKLFYIGLLLGIGIQINYLVLFDLFPILIFIYHNEILTNKTNFVQSLPRLLKSYTLLLIGPVICFLLIILYFYTNSALDEYFFANIAANIRYGSSNFSITDLTSAIKQQISTYAIIWMGILLTPLYLFFWKDVINQRDEKFMRVAVLWAILVIIGISFSRRFYFHYFLHLLPPACLLIAYLVIRVIYIQIYTDSRTRAFLLSLVLLIPITQNILPTLEKSAGLIYYRKVKGIENWANEPAEIAKYLEGRIHPGDYIYAVDINPVIYTLVPVEKPTKYIFPPHLTDQRTYEFSRINGVQELALIMDKRPKYIVKQYREETLFYDELEEYLARFYVYEESIAHAQIYRLKYPQ